MTVGIIYSRKIHHRDRVHTISIEDGYSLRTSSISHDWNCRPKLYFIS